MRPKTSSLFPSTVQAELRLPSATVQIVGFDYRESRVDVFSPKDVYWLDLPLTPRSAEARGRYVDLWSAHRYKRMGTLLLSPGHVIQVKNDPYRRTSLICQLHADAVRKRFQMDFKWSDRQLEASLDVTNPVIRDLLRRLAHELRHPGAASEVLAEAIAVQLSVEVGRYCTSPGETCEAGGLSPWRLQILDKRMSERGNPPTLHELAGLCKISVRQLTRGFRASRGSSIGDYLVQSRMETAKSRLAAGESVKAIAGGMGFASSSGFTQAFIRATGFTPTYFRNRILTSDRSGLTVDA